MCPQHALNNPRRGRTVRYFPASTRAQTKLISRPPPCDFPAMDVQATALAFVVGLAVGLLGLVLFWVLQGHSRTAPFSEQAAAMANAVKREPTSSTTPHGLPKAADSTATATAESPEPQKAPADAQTTDAKDVTDQSASPSAPPGLTKAADSNATAKSPEPRPSRRMPRT